MEIEYDQKILECLDGDWRTITQIRTRLRKRAAQAKLASTLRRLADARRIERYALETGIPKRQGSGRSKKVFAIQYFRRQPDR